MRGKRAKHLRKAVKEDWDKLQGKKNPFQTVMRRIRRAYSRGLIKSSK